MAGLSSIGESTVLNALLSSVYVSLHTADPGNAGGSEVTGNAYLRQPVTFSDAGNNPTIASNNAIVSFPVAAPAGWGTVTNFGLWTGITSGQYLGGQALTTARTIMANDVARFLTGALQVSAD